MVAARSLRPILAAALIGLAGLITPVRADEKIVWKSDRTSSPETVAELKGLQEQVKKIVQQVSPSTVGLIVEFPADDSGPAESGAGSGVIVSEDGLVLTAAHVICKEPEGGRARQSYRRRVAREIKVVLSDGTLVDAKGLGVNRVDGGMLRITGKPPKTASWPGAKDGKWPVAKIGDSDSLKEGQWVVSLGHPGGPRKDRPPAVRVGRYITYIKSETAIRTDCTLVGGDSGGPLFDLNGNVVGIHSRIGLFLTNNMHVPAAIFQEQWDRLVRGEVIGQRVTVETGFTLNDNAATLKSIVEEGPAAKAGLEEGDLILKWNGEKVKKVEDLAAMLTGFEPNEVVPVEIKRDGQTMTLKLTLAKKPTKK